MDYFFDYHTLWPERSAYSQPTVVFGYEHCLYKHLDNDLSDVNFQSEKNSRPSSGVKDVKYRYADPLNWKTSNDNSKRYCKSLITSLIYNNGIRKLEGLPIIPLLFCIDITNNPYPLSPISIARIHNRPKSLLNTIVI